MIKIFLLDFYGAEVDKNFISALPDYITNTKNEKLKRERIFSHLLLKYAYEERFSAPMPNTERDEYGRPYFPKSKLDFNISHDTNMAALVISDGERVGIDIQLCKESVSKRLSDKLGEIYKNKSLASILKKDDSLSAEISVLRVCFDVSRRLMADTEKRILPPLSTSDFFRRWTALEAISKADGRGVFSAERIDYGQEKINLKSIAIEDGEKNLYSICVCEMSKK